MKEYPATSQAFKVNGKTFKMQKMILGLQAKIEDENIAVTYKDVIEACTDMGADSIEGLHLDQFEGIYEDITLFTYDATKSEDGEPKKPSS